MVSRGAGSRCGPRRSPPRWPSTLSAPATPRGKPPGWPPRTGSRTTFQPVSRPRPRSCPASPPPDSSSAGAGELPAPASFERNRSMPSENALLERVRKLLAKAEAVGTTPADAEALTAKAAELMARYGIDRALLAAARPEPDKPADRIIDIANPWARIQAHLLCGLASAMRCQCVVLPRTGPGSH